MTADPHYIPTACTIGSQYICGKERATVIEKY